MSAFLPYFQKSLHVAVVLYIHICGQPTCSPPYLLIHQPQLRANKTFIHFAVAHLACIPG